jgi:2,4-dienoyl-CoA reductase-like NADH-dependent reductase (Old Yellow Enzyme family)
MTTSPVLSTILTPVDVGPFTLKNRMMITGHQPYYSPTGLLSDLEIAYHVRKAQGGFALTTTAASVHPSSPNNLINFDDAVIPGYTRLAEQVHAAGARVMVQLAHGGAAGPSNHSGHPTWAASQVLGEFAFELPHVMTIAEIETVVDAFAQAASRVRASGLDGVELNVYAGSLVQQFLSPYSNKRHDRYGGAFENRLRFVRELIEACREALGSGLALSIKLTADELVDGGLRLPEAQEIVGRLDELSMIDFYVVGTGNNLERFARVDHWPPAPAPHGLYSGLAAGIRQVTSRPVAALARIVDPAVADGMIAEGVCDLVAMVRASVADPDLPLKVAEGRLDDIRPCVGDNQSCVDRILTGLPMRCIYNPEVGHEGTWSALQRSPAPKRVVIIGGGPAGLEAARVAAIQGHHVVLLERAPILGGRALLAARQPGRDEMIHIPMWLIAQVDKLGVDVRVGTEANATVIQAEEPELIIVASGASETDPDPRLASSGLPVVSASSVLSGAVEPGQNVIVVDHTGQSIGCAVAELVADRGGSAEVVTRHFHPTSAFGLTNTISLYRRLFRKGVRFTPHSDLTLQDRSLTVTNCYSGKGRQVERIDMLIVVTLPVANDGCIRVAEGCGVRVMSAGDCVAPRDIETATLEGHVAARKI